MCMLRFIMEGTNMNMHSTLNFDACFPITHYFFYFYFEPLSESVMGVFRIERFTDTKDYLIRLRG